jgi:hypothetical protein
MSASELAGNGARDAQVGGAALLVDPGCVLARLEPWHGKAVVIVVAVHRPANSCPVQAYSAAIAMMTNEIGRGILVGASFDRQECL